MKSQFLLGLLRACVLALVLALSATACGSAGDEVETSTSTGDVSSGSDADSNADEQQSVQGPDEASPESPTETPTPAPTEAPTPEPTEAPATEPVGAEHQAAMDAFALVFDSNAAWADKAPFLENAAALEASNTAYGAAGEAMGGISLAPTGAEVDGDMATITYDVMFGASAAYQDLTRTISLVDGAWVVSQADYCDFLSSARTPCELSEE